MSLSFTPRHRWVALILATLFLLSPRLSVAAPVRSTLYNGAARTTFPHRAEFDATVAMTVECWLYLNSSNRFHTLVSHNWQQSYWFGVNTANHLRFYRSGGLPNFADSTAFLQAGRWTHVAVTYDGTTARFYVDGVAAGDAPLANAGANRSQALWLGDDINGGLSLNGQLDEVRIWSTARSASQIATNRFMEGVALEGLVARFPAGGAQNTISGIGGAATGTAQSLWGVLPRDYVVPRAVSPLLLTSDLSEFSSQGAERMICRYRTVGGAEHDVEGYLLYRSATGDQNLYLAMPSTPQRANDLGILRPLWFSFMVDTNNAGSPFPQPDDLRIDSRVDNVSSSVSTNIARTGNGVNWQNIPLPLPASQADWEVVGAPGCEFDCGRIYRISASALGGLTGVKRVLFGEFAYPNAFFSALSWPSALDADPNAPRSWPYLTFGSLSESLPLVSVDGTAIDLTAGTNVPLQGVKVSLYSPTTGTVFASGLTDANGVFRLSAPVFPTNSQLRVGCSVPTTGLWRQLTPEVDPADVAVIGASEFTGVTFGFPTASRSSDLGTLRFRLIQHRGVSIAGVSPNVGNPHILIRESPRKVTPATQITLTGSNLNPFCTYYLMHRSCDPPTLGSDPLPTGSGCTNFPLTVISRSADWTSVTLELDFDVRLRFNVPADQWLIGGYRVLVHDDWVPRWIQSPDLVTLSEDAYPLFHGFEFVNERDGTQFDEFSGVYQWNAYDCATPIGPIPGANPCIGCRVPDPVYLTFYSIPYSIWVENMTGSCLGMSATSLLLKRRELTPEGFVSGVQYANGLPGVPIRGTNALGETVTNSVAPPKPQEHRFRVCDYSEPVNLWAHIHRNQAVQTSAEFLGSILGQMHGTSLGVIPDRRYSIDGDPMAVLSKIRSRPFEYLLCFQNQGNVFESHCTVPYRILDDFGYDTNATLVAKPGSTAIFVYDSNHPGNTGRFLEIIRTNNTMQYQWSFREVVTETATNVVPVFWTGTGCYATPISLWRTARTMPGADLLSRGLTLVMFGSGDVQHEDRAGGRWGWDAAGTFLDTYVGGKAIAPFTALPADDGVRPLANSSRNVLFFPPTNSPPVLTRVNARGKDWTFFAAEAGIHCQLSAADATPGAQDRLELVQEGGVLNGFAFHPSKKMLRLIPRMGVQTSNSPPASYEWLGLNFSPGNGGEFTALRQLGGVRFRNMSGATTTHTLRVVRNGPDGLGTNDFGPFTLPTGGIHITRFTGWPAPTLRSEVDMDGDGQVDLITFVTPSSDGNTSPPALSLHRSPGSIVVSWPAGTQSWRLLQTDDLDGSSVIWKPVAQAPTESGGKVSVQLPAGASQSFFRLERIP